MPNTWKLLSSIRWSEPCLDCKKQMYVGETAWWLKGRGILHPGCGLGSNKQPLQTTPKLMVKHWVKVPVEHKDVGNGIDVDVSDNIPFTDEWLDEAHDDFKRRQKILEREFQDQNAWRDFQRDK